MEIERVNHVQFINEEHKKSLGQYFTPIKIAQFMASLFPTGEVKEIKILDPGAGIGILACSLIERIKLECWPFRHLEVDAFEIDTNIIDSLRTNLKSALKNISADMSILSEDFLDWACQPELFDTQKRYTHVIMNPPYSKINAKSKERLLLRSIGIETGNLYSGFLAAAIRLTAQAGHIVAIIPRSFCNGAYFEPFRKYLLEHCSIKQIHLFESRKDAFKDESVLQENIILHIQKGVPQEYVLVSYSTRSDFKKLKKQYYQFKQIIDPKDSSNVISIPIPGKETRRPIFDDSLPDLGISISTGPIVGYRKKELLERDFVEGSYPLVFPTHQKNFLLDWPKTSKKPNAIKADPVIEKDLFPLGNYVIVKRFSSKEEKRRLVATVITAKSFPSEFFTAENHLNIMHVHKHGMEIETAYGLFAYLNSTYADEQFRLFSGHTQVNATDLKNFRYPTLETLKEIGRAAMIYDAYDQSVFDSIFDRVVNTNEPN